MRDERTPKGDCEEATTLKESRHITCILEGKLSKCEVDVSPRKCNPLCLFFQLELLLFPCLPEVDHVINSCRASIQRAYCVAHEIPTNT